jgi:hypothetical protein
MLRGASVEFVLVAAIVGGAATGSAHDLIPVKLARSRTTCESLIAEICSPCVKNSYAFSTLPLAR